jgi:hypothetical protein
VLRSKPHHAHTRDDSLSSSACTQAAVVRALVDEGARYSSTDPRSVALREQLKEERGRLARLERAQRTPDCRRSLGTLAAPGRDRSRRRRRASLAWGLARHGDLDVDACGRDRRAR